MKFRLECVPCLLQQALRVFENTGRKATREEKKALLDRVMDVLRGNEVLDALPGITGARVYRVIGEVLGDPDPFKAIKRASNEHAASLYPRLTAMVAASEDPLATAVKIAIVGNLIDLGADITYDLDVELDRLHLAIDDLDAFRRDLRAATRVLYCGDNAGEIFFDKVLLQAITRVFPVTITFSVRGGPVINDATMDDAITAGIDEIATVVEASASPGVVIAGSSKAFQEAWNEADIVISKGQGNFETLPSQVAGKTVYYMLKVKCKIIEEELDVPVGSSVLARGAPVSRG